MPKSIRPDGKVALWVRPEIQNFLEKQKRPKEAYDDVLYRILQLEAVYVFSDF